VRDEVPCAGTHPFSPRRPAAGPVDRLARARIAVGHDHGEPGPLLRDGQPGGACPDGPDARVDASRRLRGGLHRPGLRVGAARYFGDRGVRARASFRVGGGSRQWLCRPSGCCCSARAARCCTATYGRCSRRPSCSPAWCCLPRSSRRRFRRLPGLSCRAPLRGSPPSSPGSGCSSSACSCRPRPPGAACGSISRPTPWRRCSSAARRCSIPPSPR